MEIGELLALSRDIHRLPATRAGVRASAVERDDELSLLDDDQDPAAPDSLLADEVRELHTERLVADLKIDTSIGRRLAETAIEALGRVWRYDKILARLLSRPTRRNLEDARKAELAREVVHRAMINDLEVIRLLKMPAGGVAVQVQAVARDGGQVNVGVAPERGPIPKRRR